MLPRIVLFSGFSCMVFLKELGCEKGAAGAFYPALSTFIFLPRVPICPDDKAAIQ
jgi:hypothetical protein